jgi:hypothetical protein
VKAFGVKLLIKEEKIAISEDSNFNLVTQTRRKHQAGNQFNLLRMPERHILHLTLAAKDQHTFDLQFPSVSWFSHYFYHLFSDEPSEVEEFDKNSADFDQFHLYVKERHKDPLWEQRTLDQPEGASGPYPFLDLLFTAEFQLNPESDHLQKLVLNQWLLDIIADLGGFCLSVYLFWGLFCGTVPVALMYAAIAEDTYRVKFNKYLKKEGFTEQDAANADYAQRRNAAALCSCWKRKKTDDDEEESKKEDSFTDNEDIVTRHNNKKNKGERDETMAKKIADLEE